MPLAFPCSSVAEQATVNRWVVGSIPTGGAMSQKVFTLSNSLSHYFFGASGATIVILHGLFGAADNWRAVAKALAADYQVILVDLRNHGNSPHLSTMTYQEMSEDVIELLDELNLSSVILMGHSMGGKVAMQVASQHPHRVTKLIIVDIAPKIYAPHHQDILAGLKAVEDEAPLGSRREAGEVLSKFVNEDRVRQFLLKSYVGDEESQQVWQFNTKAIAKEYESILEAPHLSPSSVDTTFIRGSESDYILDSDIKEIQKYFPQASVITIENAGHWVHAEQFNEFMKEIRNLL